MSTIGDQIAAGRKTIERSLGEVREMEMPDIPPPVLVAAGVAAGIMAFGVVGWLIFRRRRRQTLVQRLQDALPDTVRELPHGLRDQIRRVR
ncbi:MAG TPA: hypothetical protein VLK30_07075 [Candidatus Limnocylindrales bacterium]|nr:hypothetical protein [Candidatus Limnocylindrales bacterium]